MLKKLINWYWNIRYPELSTEQVNKVFDQFDSIQEFASFLKAAGFKWSSDGLNFCQATDTFERPGQVLARRFANCGGYMRLFKEFCLYKGFYDYLAEYELTDGVIRNRWHYISVIVHNGKIFSQSNMDILEFPTDDHIVDFWRMRYRKMTLIREHRKEIGG